MPNYANHLFRYDHYEGRSHDDAERCAERRSTRSSRRRSRKRTSSTPTMTVNGRRNKRWAW